MAAQPEWATLAERELSTIVPTRAAARALAQPTFDRLHALVSAVTLATGFGRGLFTPDELVAEELTTATSRLQYISKVAGLVGVSLQGAIDIKPIADAVLLDGADPEPLGRFYAALARAARAAAEGDAGEPSARQETPRSAGVPPAATSHASSRPGPSRTTATARRRVDVPAAPPPPPPPPGGAAWSCAFCGHAHEDELPYCELCAKLRKAPPVGRSDGAVHLNAAARGGARADERAASDRTSSRGEGRPRPPGATASAARTTRPTHTDRPTASHSARGIPAPGAAASTYGRGAAGRAGGRAAPARRGRGVRPAPEAEPDAHLEDEEADEDTFFEQQAAARWRAYQQEQKVKAAEAEKREAGERARRREAAAAAAEAAAAESSSSGSAGAAHEAAWKRFAHAANDAPIHACDVPWPRLEAAALGLDARYSNASERKQAFRAASLRWHPDKFVGSFGARLVAGERDAILARVTEVSQAINALYQAAEARA
jgi:hypothetical protein